MDFISVFLISCSIVSGFVLGFGHPVTLCLLSAGAAGGFGVMHGYFQGHREGYTEGYQARDGWATGKCTHGMTGYKRVKNCSQCRIEWDKDFLEYKA